MSLMPTQEDATRVHIIVKKTFLECIPDRRRDEAQSLAGCSEPIIDWSDMAEDESIGSRLHGSGLCKPCAWHWKKGGCKNGAECRHCHKCPKGEVTRRKRSSEGTGGVDTWTRGRLCLQTLLSRFFAAPREKGAVCACSGVEWCVC
ncbi:Uncharacterized protein SCF082_LOCUS51465 [Durusdinium trenchii]|uniref:C3H1-type domain-containing protein n=1 Tax=Durusdinium trenchii TaxID=1381693 RepID=A0ABP0SEQ2_9DINO